MPKRVNYIPVSEKTLLTVREASYLSGLAINKIYAICNREDVNFVVKQGKKNLIQREKFNDWLNGNPIL